MSLVFTDEEIISAVCREKPALVAIDAPLGLPPGRSSIDQRNGRHFRPCDEELRRRRIPFFPITLGPMRILTKRGMRLKDLLVDKGYRVVEIYPGGAQDIWGIPRAKRSLKELREGLERMGVEGLDEGRSAHELDAVSGALVGRLFLEGRAEVYGGRESEGIVMPFPHREGGGESTSKTRSRPRLRGR